MKSCPSCSAKYGDENANCPRDGSFLLFEPGSVIRKKYEIVSVIGSGGMGVVYRARHLHFNEDRALKVFSGKDKDTGQGLRRLIAEARVMRQLQHPNIVHVEDTDVTDHDLPFVVMEFVDGRGLDERLFLHNGVPLQVALAFTAEACSALAATHKKGIFHRDIKPQNLLIAKDAAGNESVKIIDFGIATVRSDAGLGFTGVLSGNSGFAGTWAYASPEQLEGKALDGRSDLYSLGLVLYEMLTGKRPFPAETVTALVDQRLRGQPMPLEEARPDLKISFGLKALVMKSIATDPNQRFQTGEELGRAIAELRDESRVAAVWVKRVEKPTLQISAETKPLGKVNPKDGLTYVWIPPGEFMMGSSVDDAERTADEPRARKVRIEKGFWLAQAPVTQEAFLRVMDSNPSYFTGGQRPVDSVTLAQAQSYCAAIGGRLPTEAEWEYAARGGTSGSRYGELDEIAWFGDNSGARSQDVSQKQPNKFGLYDMLGNVWEWTVGGPDGPNHPTLRGGAWYGNPVVIRASYRLKAEPRGRVGCVGFRCVED